MAKRRRRSNRNNREQGVPKFDNGTLDNCKQLSNLARESCPLSKEPSGTTFKRPKGFSNSTLDKLWSTKVKELAGHKCELCGSTDLLQSHHIHRCKHYGVRWNLNNGCCLCQNCHQQSEYSAHKNQLYFFREMIRLRGDDWADKVIKATVGDKSWRERLVSIKHQLQSN
jgi:hypothetical protein